MREGERERNLREELAQCRSELIKRDKLTLLALLSAGLAHEINNPLTVMIDCVHALRAELDGDVSPPVARKLSRLDLACSRMSEIVKGVQRFSRTEVIGEQAFSVAELLEGAAGLTRDFLMQHRIDLDLSLPGEALELRGDYGLLSQVLLNLVMNAKDAILSSRRERGLVVLSAFALDDRLEISVQDNGAGMSESVRQSLFQPFASTKKSGQGTGLGLSMAQTIIHAHGGKILCDSVAGEGSRFRLVLPRSCAVAA